jgi:hypothetical protein
MVLLASLALLGPTTLAQTNEWKAYRALVSKARCMQVVMMALASDNPARGGLGGIQLTTSKDGWAVLETPEQETRWNGKAGVYIDHKSKTWRRVKGLDLPPLLSYLALPPDNFDGRGFELYKLEMTRMGEPSTRGEVGWRILRQGRDARQEATYWFDGKTHLPREVAIVAQGRSPAMWKTLYIGWDLKADIAKSQRTLAPPHGYSENLGK